MAPLVLLSFALVAAAQQVYISVDGPVARPKCRESCGWATATPTYSFSEFSFTQTETVRTATAVVPGPTTTFAAPYQSLSHLVPDLSTTTWGNWDPNATTTATDSADPYGSAAWSSLWDHATLSNFTYRGLYSATVSPTPVPTSELVLPPPDYLTYDDCYYFPEGFILGAAGSASQIEGAIADEGRSPALMEIHLPDNTIAGAAYDYVAIENYYMYRVDIERLAAMGVKYYSFSIAWARIVPFGLTGTPVNKQGLDHYDDLINFCIEKGMQPIVTLIHYDTPLNFYANLSEQYDTRIGYRDGKYGDEDFQAGFLYYGKILMTHFADRVPIWITFNEPFYYCDAGKSVDGVIKLHAQLSHFYHDEIKGTGKISLKFSDSFGVPSNPNNQSDIDAANHWNDLQIATFANPIFLGEDYPEAFKMTVPDYVPLNATDLAYIKGTADFFGIDFYTATVATPPSGGIAACAANTSDPLFPYCINQGKVTTTGWNIGYRGAGYVYTTPTYLRTFLNYLWNNYKTTIMVTELGFPVFGENIKLTVQDELLDNPRSQFYLSHMSEILKAIWEDHVDVSGVLAWSFADNWELGSFDAHFGMQYVDRTTQKRSFKKSFFDLVDFVAARTHNATG